MVLMAPSDENEARQMLYTGYRHKGPAAVRYPRGTGPGVTIEQAMSTLPLGKGVVRRQGKGIAILNFGALLPEALKAADQLNATVADMRFVKPLDGDLIHALAREHDLLVTLEDNVVMGGAGSAVAEYLAANCIMTTPLLLGLPDHFIDHAPRDRQLSGVGLDSEGILASIRHRLSAQTAYRRWADPA